MARPRIRDGLHEEMRNMKRIDRSMQALVGPMALMGIAAAVALSASADEYRLKQDNCNDNSVPRRWGDAGSWEVKDEFGVWGPASSKPNSDDLVWIQNDKCVYIIGGDASAAHEEAGEIYVCKSGETTGECNGASGAGVINIVDGSSLTLYEDSVVNGEIVFYSTTVSPCQTTGELRIRKSDDLEIDGNGGKIRTGGANGRIKAHSSICEDEATCDTRLIIDGATPGNDNTSMTVRTDGGCDIEISVKLGNQGDVHANYGDIRLTTSRKNGNPGFYRASGGKIEVDHEVRGGATWRLEGTGGEIQFDVECVNLSGPFYIPMGVLRVNQLVCTTGHGYYGGQIGENPQDAFIRAAAGKKITFHGDCD
ncbi:MAG: hypothetical protein EDS66_01915 [Planctomycetota bacterium]|nr:MAG: hypothetical protein EDS66_01915 [Planctomycetota bacterium]MCQ3920322.1 hypothetical protein [Planctomycetota bacterium]